MLSRFFKWLRSFFRSEPPVVNDTPAPVVEEEVVSEEQAPPVSVFNNFANVAEKIATRRARRRPWESKGMYMRRRNREAQRADHRA